MIITCPSCSVKFSVADAAIPPQGRKLKCSKCEFLWHFKPAKAASAEEAAPPPKGEHPLRAKASSAPMPRHVRMGAPLWMTGVAALLLIAAGGLAGLTWFSGIFGLPSSNGLTLADISLKAVVDNESKPAGYALDGHIVNATQEARRAPDVRFVLTDKQGKPLKSWSVAPDAGVIAPGGKLHFSSPVPEGEMGMKLRLDVGNPLELLLRPLK